MDRRKKLDFLRAADIFCVPVDHIEPKGLFALEALAAGTPVVLPRRGALEEIVETSGGGLLYDPRLREQLVDRLKLLLRDPTQRIALAKSGRDFVLNHRNETSMALQTIDVLQKFLCKV